jgi:ABC-type transporter Mla subunit MlaD
MASLKDTRQLTKELEEMIGEIKAELSDGNVDFDKLVSMTDQLSEQADNLAETFSTINDALMERLGQAKSGAQRVGRQAQSKAQSAKSSSGS